jgi:lipopolysaccharide heptosyltransferase I
MPAGLLGLTWLILSSLEPFRSIRLHFARLGRKALFMTYSDDLRILVCRLSALGDCVHTMPLVCALRRNYPNAHIAWLTQSGSLPLLAGHDDVDEFITVERGFLRSPRQVADLRRRLKPKQFDITIDPQSLTKSAVPAWLSGAKTRIGFASHEGREAAPWLNNVLVRPERRHVVDRNMELLRPLGIEHADVEFKLPLDKTAFANVDTLLDECLDTQTPVVMHPGAGWRSKLWPHLRYAEVARFLGQEYGFQTMVLWVGEQMRAWAKQIAKNSGGFAVMAPVMSLPELIALLFRARLFIGSDSGPLHMAAALETPTVSMFGPTLPDRNGPYGQGHSALQAYYQAGTTRQRRSAPNDAMQAITSEMVIQMCRQVLDPVTPVESPTVVAV